METRTGNTRERVLVVAPTGKDASLVATTLAQHGIGAQACPDVASLLREVACGAGAVLVAEEALTREHLEMLSFGLQAQPAWSDLPIILLSIAGESTPINRYRIEQLSPVGNVTCVERPIRPATLISVVKTALRARRRQYDVERLLNHVRVAEERLRTMIESAQDYAIVNLDLDGRVTFWNSGAERLLGYPDAQVVGQPYSMLFTEQDRSDSVPECDLATALGSGRSETEGWRLRLDGSRFWASGVVCPTKNGTGQATGFVAVMRDMTERKQVEERLAEQARALERSNEDLQRFAYIASHDLQEPLRMIGSFSQLLARKNEGRLDEDSQQYVTYILAGVERMETLIRDLLEFSRVTREVPQTPQPVDCNAVLESALQHLQHKISETGAKVNSDRLPHVLAHETRLLQVFQNLLGNALKYCERVPEIHITAAREGRHWRISIRDNGIGIAPEYRERVFGLFERLHSRNRFPGTGIGLATCKRIIEQNGGSIWVECSGPGGSTFSFTVPGLEPLVPPRSQTSDLQGQAK